MNMVQAGRTLVTRTAVLRTLIAISPAWVPLDARAVIGEVTGPGFLQADDKSWDITLPSTWMPSTNLRAEAEHVFHLRAARSSGGASLEVLVDKVKGKTTLKDLGSLEVVGQRYAVTPSAELVSSAVVPGPIRGSTYYEYTYAHPAGGGTTRLKLGVQQNRVYQLAIALPSSPSSAEVEAEAAGILDSFKCFPINIICISQSNKGIVPVAGSCY
jgi:hypothetical protein